MESENDALNAVLHAVRRGGVGGSVKVARHYRVEAVLGLERSIQRDFNMIGRRHLINADDGGLGGVGRVRRMRNCLVKTNALLALRRDSRSSCFQGCAFLIAGRARDTVRSLKGAGSSTNDPDLASAIDLTLASALRRIGSLHEWLEMHMRCATRERSSLRIVGRVFATFAALRTENNPVASKLLEASYDASQVEIRSAHAELAGFFGAASKENPHYASSLKTGLRRFDGRGLWLELLDDATKNN